MNAPLYSTITLFAELIVSAIIYYTFYQGYKHNKFPTKLVAAALLYEFFFNISYMASRAHRTSQHTTVTLPPGDIIFAAVHGILSLLMFIALVVFMVIAWRKYTRGTNYFALHKKLTTVFLLFWTISIVSGVTLYIMEYVAK